jgi:hypothetical protein
MHSHPIARLMQIGRLLLIHQHLISHYPLAQLEKATWFSLHFACNELALTPQVAQRH